MSDFEKTNIYRLMQRSQAVWEENQREEREREATEARKRAQRGTSTPADEASTDGNTEGPDA